MCADVPPLVELAPAPIIHASGIGRIDVIDGFAHYFFFELMHDGIDANSQIVRAVNLHLIVPVSNSIEGMKITAEALGLTQPVLSEVRLRLMNS